jgi:hypothetical protein
VKDSAASVTKLVTRNASGIDETNTRTQTPLTLKSKIGSMTDIQSTTQNTKDTFKLPPINQTRQFQQDSENGTELTVYPV